jgi:hypothetical protein
MRRSNRRESHSKRSTSAPAATTTMSGAAPDASGRPIPYKPGNSAVARTFWSTMLVALLVALCAAPASFAAGAPVVTTGTASAVGLREVTLKGTVNPEGSETTYQFEYGTTTEYGTSVPVPAGNLGSVAKEDPVSQTITGLSPGTTYHFRLRASNSHGTSYGADAVVHPASWDVGGLQLTEPLSVTTKSTLKLADLKGGLLQESVTFECSYSNFASDDATLLGPGNAGEVTNDWQFGGCHAVSGSCGSGAEIETQDKPWHTELADVEGAVRERVGIPGAGKPEFTFTCTGQLKAEDKCSGATSAAIENTSAGANELFDSHAEKLTCNRGGVGAGLIEGTQAIENPTGGALTAVSGLPEWQVGGKSAQQAVAVTSAGTLKLADSKGGLLNEKMAVECSVSGKGVVGRDAAGEITQRTFSSCKPSVGGCTSPTVSAAALPWHSALGSVGGVARNAIGGTIEYTISCPTLKIEDKCSGPTSVATEDVSGGVDELYDSKSEKLTCSRGGTGTGSIEGSELIESPAGGTLTVK